MSDDLVRVGVPPRRDGPLRCALCHGDVDEAGSARCAGCGTLLHPDCRSQLGSCPTLGCEAWSARPVVAAAAKADAPVERLPRLPLRACVSTTFLLPGWFGLSTALQGGGDMAGLSAIAALLLFVPPTLLVQLVLQLVLRAASSRGRPVSELTARRATLAPLVLLLLGLTVHEVYEARFRITPEVVGEVVAGGARAEVVRREELKFELGDDPYLVTWTLRVTDSQGRVQEGVIDREEASRLEGPRAARYDLAWRPAGDALNVVRRSDALRSDARGVAYVFPAGVRAIWHAPGDVVRLDDRATPLDDDVRARLTRLPLPAEAWQGLSMVRVDDVDDESARGTQWVCERPDVLVVLGPREHGYRHVVARGPILVTGVDSPFGDVASGAWAFYDDETSPRRFLDPVLAERIFVTRAAYHREDDVVRAPEIVPAR